MGFMPRRENADKPRPAAVLVSLRAQDVGAAEAAAKAGADAIILAGWKPGGDITAFKAAAESGKTLWGVRYDGAGNDEPMAAAKAAGAGFILLSEEAAVGALFDEDNPLDRIVSIAAPETEWELLTLRAVNTLPAQAALVALPKGVAALRGLPTQAFARLALIAQSLRFPLLAEVDEAPDLIASRALVRLGIDGIVLSGVGVESSALASQIQAVRADLEKIPPLSKGEGVNLGALPTGASLMPAQPKPERDPDHDPDEE
jgi:hypothetical protein